MSFRLWKYKEPLYLNNFGIMEPRYSNQKLIPDLILVPFVGSGTECLSAQNNKRNFIGFELNKGYIKIANKRLLK